MSGMLNLSSACQLTSFSNQSSRMAPPSFSYSINDGWSVNADKAGPTKTLVDTIQYMLLGAAVVVAFKCNAPGRRFGPTLAAICFPDIYLAQRLTRALLIKEPSARLELWRDQSLVTARANDATRETVARQVTAAGNRNIKQE